MKKLELSGQEVLLIEIRDLLNEINSKLHYQHYELKTSSGAIKPWCIEYSNSNHISTWSIPCEDVTVI